VPKRSATFEVILPELRAVSGLGLEPGDAYDAVELRDLDLSGQQVRHSRFIESGLYNCQLDGTSLRGAHLTDCVLDGLRATAVDFADSSWGAVEVTACRFGALTVHGSTLQRVRVSGGKIDFLNARGAQLSDVRFEGCRLAEVHLGGAKLTRVSFVDCQIDQLELAGAQLDQVDLSQSELHVIGGIGSLSGAIISDTQLTDLATAFAAHLNVTVAATR
jgi:uncharacterized protein YjbI with pentapeptide repeats